MGDKGILVIGMGNVLMQDEGIGVRAVEELEARYHIPESVTVVDGGTTGMELFNPIRNCDQLVVADAVNTGAPPGTLVRIANGEIPAFFQTKLSNHQLGLSDLLALLTLKDAVPEHVAIIGMVPHSLENKLGLTPAAQAGLDGMVAMLVHELCEIGAAPWSRARAGVGHWRREAEYEAGMPCA
ncbi:MAG: hydrogenase expression/formation protein [Candidatus Sedimenticola endophacoides]|uniref:HyaD/HybD family hydrogenase maturation endopeptidase n=1 Tax=Candidatus Sedimenticola endophacoides TaxID=2548426 RepID=A0A657PRU4_9GAMM|nr:MAG: hydrogenase expression/formation protein [Candidatus Sedimenticola endophacoides]OQX32954.1 MAG: hydrogenase expression/formation protein [Candidatus Sedimenticola endophacoides]OQX37017.1 MAG: hydrogenase expression/formation protein [Candidatus Sedimenticola endophacoides]OQX39477.1 MAG: hydrogenase expression/formation protein [Candidatus Sedimenticola endophacoides]OQX41242.1 MAG: hydrogenase expression/formation protein [Candidatus Sedimenticola endophacoides]